MSDTQPLGQGGSPEEPRIDLDKRRGDSQPSDSSGAGSSAVTPGNMGEPRPGQFGPPEATNPYAPAATQPMQGGAAYGPGQMFGGPVQGPQGYGQPGYPPPGYVQPGYPPAYGYVPPYVPYYGPPPTARSVVEQRFGPVADFGSRLGAYVIDAIFGAVFLGISIGCWIWTLDGEVNWRCTERYSYYYGENRTTCDWIDTTDRFGLALTCAILSVLLFIATYLWNRCFRQGRKGASLGKAALGLRLIDARTGQPVGAGRAFARDLVNGLSDYFVFCLPFGRMWMLWDDDRQTLGDKAITATVIKV